MPVDNADLIYHNINLLTAKFANQTVQQNNDKTHRIPEMESPLRAFYNSNFIVNHIGPLNVTFVCEFISLSVNIIFFRTYQGGHDMTP